jgi:hypothetical protein
MAELKWQKVEHDWRNYLGALPPDLPPGTSPFVEAFYVRRAEVPSGWLVVIEKRENYFPVFVPDPSHSWQ